MRYLPLAFAALLMLSFLPIAPAIGDEQDKKQTDLAPLIQSISQLKTTLDDEYERYYLQGDVLAEATIVAWLARDQKALAVADEHLKRLIERGKTLEDPYIHDNASVYVSLVTAAMGDPVAAEQQAHAIQMRTYRVQALGLLAAERAYAGDAEGFSRLADESLKRLRVALLADTFRADYDREWPSWVAWSMLNEWMGVAFFSDLFEPDAAMAELTRLGKQFDVIPLEPGAEAEVYALIATGFAVLGDKDTANAWLAKTEKPLIKEQVRVDKAEQDESAWWYGTDAARIDIVRANTLLGNHDAAAKQLELIERQDMRLWCNTIIAGYAKSVGQHENAEPLLKQAAQSLRQGDQLIRVALAGPRDAKEANEARQLVLKEEHWQDYDEFNLFWDSYYFGMDLTLANDKDRLAEVQAALQTDHAKIGLQLGAVKASLLPNPFTLVGE